MPGFQGVMTSGTLLKLQNALGLPMTGGSVFTAEMGAALEAYLATRGAPTAKAMIVAALAPFKTVSATNASLNLTDQNLNDAADAYLAYKGLPSDGSTYGTQKSWWRKNWMWIAGGGTLLAGAAVGAVWYFKREAAHGPTNGLGCGCGLGRRR